jgi:uncharacterized protein
MPDIPREAPRWLYLHGFASGPDSAKGRAMGAHYALRGVHLDRLDLRVPSLEHLRPSEMIPKVRAAIGGPEDRAVVFGSSLGGLTACRVAARDARVAALVLMAPAFDLLARWRERLRDAFRSWEETGWLEVDDHATKKRARVDFGLVRDLERLDAEDGGWPDVRVPTLIVHGLRDETVDIASSRAWAEGKRHVKLVEVDDNHELVNSLPTIAREADAHLAGFLRE